MSRVWLLVSACAACIALIGVVALNLGDVGRKPPAAETTPRAVVSIKPLHSLVASVMQGVGKPHLLIPGNSSPHQFHLRPSDARALHDAERIFWIGAALESSLVRPIRALSEPDRVVTVSALDGLQRLPTRRDSRWSEGYDPTRKYHGDAPIDPHVWLNPDNAIRIVQAAARTLSEADPMHAARYRSNAARTVERIAALDERLGAQLRDVRTVPYLVFHDAYHYFEDHYDLNAVGAVSLNPELPAGIGRIRELRDQVQRQGVRCIFREPQFRPALIETATEGMRVRVGVLDPIGAGLEPGPDAWFKLMQNLADTLNECLEE